MNCLKNINRITLNMNEINQLIELYEFKGKDFYYESVLSRDISKILDETTNEDVLNIAKMLDLSLSEQKIKMISTAKHKPSTKNEQFLLNIKETLQIAQNRATDFILLPTYIQDLVNKLFKGVKKINYAKHNSISKNDVFMRNKALIKQNELEELCSLYNDLDKLEENSEKVMLIINFYVDFINLKIFESDNDFIGLMIVITLLQREGFKLFRYTSFFKHMYISVENIKQGMLQANFNWNKGFSQISMLYVEFIACLIKSYYDIESFLREYEYELGINKSDNIENTILKLPEIFSKNDIKNKHKNISESTINRKLTELRDAGMIKPLGVGRSAKWIRVVEGINKLTDNDNISIFELREKVESEKDSKY